MAFYALVSVFGYLSTFDATPEVYVERVAPWGFDVFMAVAQALVVLSLLVNTMVNYVVLRASVFGLVFENPEVTGIRYERSEGRALAASGAFTLLTGGATLCITKLSSVLAIAGGLGSVSICFVIPLIAYCRVSKRFHSDVILSIVAGSVIGVIGIMSALHPLIKH